VCGYFPPLLNVANDPRFDGPMTKISYEYDGGSCPWSPPTNPNVPYPGAIYDRFYTNPWSIAVEKSAETGAPVASFHINCWEGTRDDFNGIGGVRKLYFGHSAGGPSPQGFHCMGYQLAKVTDFSLQNPVPAGVPSRHQNYQYDRPRQIWDGHGILTESLITLGDASGMPGEVRYVDGSTCTYDRVNPSPHSQPRDSTRIHNPYNHWLFQKKDENNQVTTHTRDTRRRVTRIDYPDTSTEEYTYNDFNQVLTHTMPSGAVEYKAYDARHRLWREWNSVDGSAEYTEYTYDTLDRVATVQDPRARANNTYSSRMEYNGRHKVIAVHYPWAQGGSDPTVRYEYDKYGNRTAVIDELGHRKDYTYDAYRRCTSMTEQLNAPGYDGTGNVPSRRWDWIYDRVIDNGTSHPLTFGASTHTSKEWRVQVEPAFNAAGDRRMTARWFDVNNRIVLEQTGWIQSAQGNWSAGPDLETHRFTYDENGQKKPTSTRSTA
jgi:YD repeat-containing protein